MPVATKKRASKQEYQSLTQLTIEGFETPFVHKLDPNNRWVKLAGHIPWDRIVGIYKKQLRNHSTGASSINPRVILGSVIIKHLKNLSDEETILEIQENIYLQYFIGYSSFTTEAPFDPSLFVEIRNRLGSSELGQINEQIVSLYNQGIQTKIEKEAQKAQNNEDSQNKHTDEDSDKEGTRTNSSSLNQDADASVTQSSSELSHKGRLLIDATACPQDIAYPTDLNLLNDARIKSEELIDRLYRPDMGFKKPRTYRKEARKTIFVLLRKDN